jgi:hypothetical protein
MRGTLTINKNNFFNKLKMFGDCMLISYMLGILVNLSNSLTMYYVYPIISDFMDLYVPEVKSDILTKGFYIGVFTF